MNDKFDSNLFLQNNEEYNIEVGYFLKNRHFQNSIHSEQ